MAALLCRKFLRFGIKMILPVTMKAKQVTALRIERFVTMETRVGENSYTQTINSFGSGSTGATGG